ncbi:MAG TPA: D-lysine 5,6-aminomutase subunit alpha, partial [Petrotoga sp.]|nr:D-lysine 5,6-aminomutase subunit alpha [Petrotoga sp.]
MNKLNLDPNKIEHARNLAKNIALDVQEYVEERSTVSTERAICRLLGIDGVDKNDVPLPNRVVEHIKEIGLLNEGAAYLIGNALIETGLTPQEIA